MNIKHTHRKQKLWESAKTCFEKLIREITANELIFGSKINAFFKINFRQAKDRYFDDGRSSLKDYPSTLGMHQMDNFSAIGSHISNQNHNKNHQEQQIEQHLSRAPSAMDPLMTGTLQSQVTQVRTLKSVMN